MAAQKISIFGRFWSKFRYDTQKARETYDYYRPVNPEMWQFWAGCAVFAVIEGLRVVFPWYLPADFPPTQAECDAYYAKRRVEITNTAS